MNKLLENKVAIVTGAGRPHGFGHEIALAFLQHGARVVVSDYTEERSTTGAEITPGALSYPCDISSEEQVKNLVKFTLEQYGRLDVIVANAGVFSVRPLADTSLADWRKITQVNLDGTAMCVRHAANAMVKNGGGSVIAVASIDAIGGMPTTSTYCASKAGLLNMCRTAALEYRQDNVRVNVISPGFFRGPMWPETEAEIGPSLGGDLTAVVTQIQGKVGVPIDLAGTAVFLASERASFVSGANWIVDNAASAAAM
jgi:NAD(P)-dependent dehydrogenase (short-subunit alcohol dehydrogenase family)